MANANGTKTIQIDNQLANEIAILAIKKNKSRKELADEAIRFYLENHDTIC